MGRLSTSALLALAAWAATTASWIRTADAAACAEVCYTTELTGFSAGGTGGCSCSGSGASRTGSGGCQCGSCYSEQSDGTIIGFAVNSDGTCTYGTNCGDCDYESTSSSTSVSTSGDSSSSGSTSTGTAAPTSTPTPTPVLTPSASNVSSTTTATPTPTPNASSQASAASASHSGDGSAGSGNAGGSTGGNAGSDGTADNAASSSSSSSSDSGLATWQIAVIICSAVLAFGVACVSILTCYCKARRRLQEHEDDFDEEVGYYRAPNHGSNGALSDGGSAHLVAHRPSSNHSQRGPRSGSLKASPPMDSDPVISTYSSSYDGNADRIGTGMRPTGGSTGDLSAYNGGGRPSQGSYSLGRRPSEEVYYTSRDRDALAVEL